MKSNLHSYYKINEDLETSGVWLQVTPKVKFLVKRFGGSNAMAVKEAMSKHYEPYSAKIKAGEIDEREKARLMTSAFVHACLEGWEGVEVDGVEVEFSKEKAIEILSDLPELSGELLRYASDKESYKEELGNSFAPFLIGNSSGAEKNSASTTV